jgi:hypothetical protein
METRFDFCLVNWKTETIIWFAGEFTPKRQALIKSYFTGGVNAEKSINVEWINNCF